MLERGCLAEGPCIASLSHFMITCIHNLDDVLYDFPNTLKVALEDRLEEYW